jgi:hypothetical protein
MSSLYIYIAKHQAEVEAANGTINKLFNALMCACNCGKSKAVLPEHHRQECIVWHGVAIMKQHQRLLVEAGHEEVASK